MWVACLHCRHTSPAQAHFATLPLLPPFTGSRQPLRESVANVPGAEPPRQPLALRDRRSRSFVTRRLVYSADVFGENASPVGSPDVTRTPAPAFATGSRRL